MHEACKTLLAHWSISLLLQFEDWLLQDHQNEQYPHLPPLYAIHQMFELWPASSLEYPLISLHRPLFRVMCWDMHL